MRDHLPALDGLRGVAILMVLLSHTIDGLPHALMLYGETGAGPSFDLPGWLFTIGVAGAHGVPLFFVVSAFTLTRQLSGLPPDRPLAWGLRRIARVGPGYWLAAAGYAALVGLGPRMGLKRFGVVDVLTGVTFTAQGAGPSAMNLVPGGWSVQCEVAYYALLPPLLIAVQARLWRAAALTLGATMLAQWSARHAIADGTWTYNAYATPLYHLPDFLAGVTAALALRPLAAIPGWVARAGAAVLVAAAVGAVPFSPIGDGVLLRSSQFAMLAAGATGLAAVSAPAVLTIPPLRNLGLWSYSLYLLHFALLWPIFTAVRRVLPGDGWPVWLLYFGLLVVAASAVATLAYRVVEQPPRRWMAAQLLRSSSAG